MNFRLKEYREASGLSQVELAKRIGKAKRTITSWEAGDSYPNVEVLCELCNMFHCTPCDMLGWWDDHERPADPALSPSEDEVLALYRASSPDRREVIRSTAELAAQATGDGGAQEQEPPSPRLTHREAM